jgi:hypothetical protein
MLFAHMSSLRYVVSSYKVILSLGIQIAILLLLIGTDTHARAIGT